MRQIIQAAREVIDLSPSFDPATDQGTIRITAPDVVETLILGPLLALIANVAPNMTCVAAPFAYQSVDALFRQPLDVAIVGEPFASREFSSERLFSETMSCMVWRDGKYGASLTEGDFTNGRHVGISHTNEPQPHPVGAALTRLAQRHRVVARASNYVGLPHAIVGTDLIATTLTSYAKLCATMLPIAVMPVPVEAPSINFVAQWQPYRDREPIIGWVLEKLRTVVRERVVD